MRLLWRASQIRNVVKKGLTVFFIVFGPSEFWLRCIRTIKSQPPEAQHYRGHNVCKHRLRKKIVTFNVSFPAKFEYVNIFWMNINFTGCLLKNQEWSKYVWNMKWYIMSLKFNWIILRHHMNSHKNKIHNLLL